MVVVWVPLTVTPSIATAFGPPNFQMEITPLDWDVYLPYFLFACREAPSSVTGFSPFDLLLGKYVCGPLDIIREQWVPSSKTPKSAAEYLQELREMLAAMRAVAGQSKRVL